MWYLSIYSCTAVSVDNFCYDVMNRVSNKGLNIMQRVSLLNLNVALPSYKARRRHFHTNAEPLFPATYFMAMEN